MSKKDIAKLMDEVQQRGFPVVITGGGHRAVLDPATGQRLATVSVTPGHNTAYDNTVRDLKRAGVLTHDPRKEGQMATPKGVFMPTAHQRRVVSKVQKVMEAGVTQADFARAIFDYARRTNGRRYKTWQAAQWQVYTIIKGDREISKWSLDHMEALADQLLAVPTAVEAPEPKVMSADDVIRSELEAIGKTIAAAFGLKPRAGRTTPHGLNPLMGNLALRAAKRNKIGLTLSHRKGVKDQVPEHWAMGKRLQDYMDGKKVWAQTRDTAVALVKDWHEGYRIRPEDLSTHAAGVKGPVPEDLLDKNVKYATPEQMDEEKYEKIDVGAIVEATKPVEPVEVAPDPLMPTTAEVRDAFQRSGIPTTTIPPAWEDGDMPLHLRMIAATLRDRHVSASLADETLAVAREIMLMELRG